ncbi:unnamed protein product [Rotaria socialis]|uniref:Uncharacterized protein n=1 Tax=Rotaria socialis TaxID=392032 RepID=A0A821RA81_9BILA|nr:unnamed protein product [Rotaria socialis]CAF3368965.1 unnamed protein product [Rotaria socialis]CAF3401702.1 unnamed protein product [Rotaria socialis]CAF4477559.1 unnamed protein product [Rotaria socialis]CAF4521707.1 unnamed protein product [Rotaria socialis]
MMLSSERSRWTLELAEESQNEIEVPNVDYSISSSFEQTDESDSSEMSEIDGRRIYCSGRDLHTINSDVFAYPDISYLELSPTREASLDFKLNELPRSIGRLAELRFLILDTNALRKLPNELCQLRELLVLVLSNNNLDALPDTIGYMEQLESIHLANNRLRKLPESFFHLKNLTFLDLSSNKLGQLSDSISELTELRSLLLFDNRLRRLPDSIGMLKCLTTLWLGRNRLRTIPRTLTTLRQLDWRKNYLSTILDENPLINPPLSVCRLGFAAIDKWHQQNVNVGLLNLDDVNNSNDDLHSKVDRTSSRFN